MINKVMLIYSVISDPALTHKVERVGFVGDVKLRAEVAWEGD
jgi:hypothetical protein